jgi:PAS domain S-box-containing protein
MHLEPDTQVRVRVDRLTWPMRYGAAFLTVVAATGVWYLSPLMHRDPFAIFVLGVVFTAHFLGFGPAVLGTALSVLAIDYVAFVPRFSFSLQSSDVARLLIFVCISLLAASLAKQKSRAQVLAEQTRERMAAIVASSNDAIYSASLKGIISSWNHGAEQLYGFSADEAIGQHLLLTVPPERTHETRSHLELLGRGENVESFRTQRLRKDGSLVDVLLSFSPLRDRNGKVVGASVIVRDMTHETRAEEALRKSEKLATAGRLTAAIAHEINNPLEALTNLLYLARRDPARGAQHLEMAEREVHRISDIAQQTLGFVRELSEPRRLSVATTLEEVLQLYSQKLMSKNIQVQEEFRDAREIYGFPGELRQLFSNLLVNAIEAMSQNGRLRLRVARAREQSSGREGVCVVFADSGRGIRPEDRARLFEPFYTTKKDSGTGLGLWLVEEIVRKHQGKIRVRSSVRPGASGTIFWLFLPEHPASCRKPVTARQYSAQ